MCGTVTVRLRAGGSYLTLDKAEDATRMCGTVTVRLRAGGSYLALDEAEDTTLMCGKHEVRGCRLRERVEAHELLKRRSAFRTNGAPVQGIVIKLLEPP